MPNPKHIDPWIRWHINLPSSLALQVETRLLDPVSGTTAYGARSKLMEQLLRDWLARSTAPQPGVGSLDPSQESA